MSQCIADIAFNLGDNFFQLSARDFPLVAGPKQAVDQFIAVEQFMASVFLDDDEGHFFDHLIRRKPTAAVLAFAPAADGLAIIGCP